jgi:hypothetical protein
MKPLETFLRSKLPPDNGVGKGRALPPGSYIDPHHPLAVTHDGVFRPGVDQPVTPMGPPPARRPTRTRA